MLTLFIAGERDRGGKALRGKKFLLQKLGAFFLCLWFVLQTVGLGIVALLCLYVFSKTLRVGTFSAQAQVEVDIPQNQRAKCVELFGFTPVLTLECPEKGVDRLDGDNLNDDEISESLKNLIPSTKVLAQLEQLCESCETEPEKKYFNKHTMIIMEGNSYDINIFYCHYTDEVLLTVHHLATEKDALQEIPQSPEDNEPIEAKELKDTGANGVLGNGRTGESQHMMFCMLRK